jgi:hypothetical protein
MDVYISAILFCQSTGAGNRNRTVDCDSCADGLSAQISQSTDPTAPDWASILTLSLPLLILLFKTECFIYIYVYICIYIQTLTNLHNLTLKMETAYTSEMTATSPTSIWCNSPRIEFRAGFKGKQLVWSPQCLQKPEMVQILLRIWLSKIMKI